MSNDVLLNSEPFKTFFGAPSRIFCAMLCLIEPHCKSFSFCRDTSCLLFNEDTHALNLLVLKPESSCVHVEMSQNERPLCEIGEDYVNIALDEGHKSELCAIKGKRTDGVWSEWSTKVLIDNSTIYRTVKTRECLYVSHGGLNCTGITEKQETVIFYWQPLTRYYENARAYCVNTFPGCCLSQAELSLLFTAQNMYQKGVVAGQRI